MTFLIKEKNQQFNSKELNQTKKNKIQNMKQINLNHLILTNLIIQMIIKLNQMIKINLLMINLKLENKISLELLLNCQIVCITKLRGNIIQKLSIIPHYLKNFVKMKMVVN